MRGVLNKKRGWLLNKKWPWVLVGEPSGLIIALAGAVCRIAARCLIFLPVGAVAEVDAGVEGGADLVGNAVGEAVEGFD